MRRSSHVFKSVDFDKPSMAILISTERDATVMVCLYRPSPLERRESKFPITVVQNGEIALDVAYNQFDEYSAIDVIIGNILPLENEKFHVTVVRSNETLADFWSPSNYTTSLRRLPPSGTIDVSVDTITLINVQYSFNTKSVDASASLYQLTFSQADQVVPIDTTDFVELPIAVTTDLTLDANVAVRLVTSPADLIYTQQVEAKAGTTVVAVLVAPAQYTVQAPSFILDSTVYVVEASTTLVVAADGSTNLPLNIIPGANPQRPWLPELPELRRHYRHDIRQPGRLRERARVIDLHVRRG
jgi:hypothetical protein